MIKVFNIKYVLIFCVLLFFAFDFSKKTSGEDESLMLAFVTYNDFGNNLYIDNITIGSRPAIDLFVNYLVGINPDTTFLPAKSIQRVSPQLVVTNAGTGSVAANSVHIILKIDEFSIFDSVTVDTSFSSGEVKVIEFDSIDIVTGVPFSVKAWIGSTVDTVNVNDTIAFNSLYLSGFPKNVLIEGFTSATSPSCAANDPFMNLFVNRNFENVSAIKYHRNVPEPGNDSMYIFNPEQSDSAKNFYNSFQVPNSVINGEKIIPLPYGTESNLNEPYDAELVKGSPLLVSVTDTLINGNIYGSVIVNITSALSPGNWKLKIMSVERYVHYDTIPLEWTQDEFFDVFRRAYPGFDGIEIQTLPGQYQFDFQYPIELGWIDTLIYTIGFVQNIDTREIVNSGKSISDTMFTNNTDILFRPFNFPDLRSGFDTDGLNISGVIPYRKTFGASLSNHTDSISTGIFYLQNFEGGFLPYNWRRSSAIGYETFRHRLGINGPAFPGTKSVVMPFYEYRNTGATDTLFTEVMTGFDISDSIRFDYAYAQYLSTFIDSLKVLASTDGGETFPFEIFNKGGADLATSPSSTISFAPTGTNQWRRYSYPLSVIFTDDPLSHTNPQNFVLYQNYPNPFNPSTTIKYFLPFQTKVRIDLYDITGRLLANLVNDLRPEGINEFHFVAENISSGIYFYKLSAGSFNVTKKMVVVR